MTDISRIIRRALALTDRRTRRRVAGILCATLVISVLDTVGLLLLVPFLSFVGSAGSAHDNASALVQRVAGTMTDEQVALILALIAVCVFVVKDLVSIGLLWIQTGVLYRAQGALAAQVVQRFADSEWLDQQDSDTGGLIRSATTAATGWGTVVGASLAIASDGMTFLAVLMALLLVQPALAAGTVLYLGAAGVLYLRVLRREIERRGGQYQAESRRMSKSLVELAGGIKELVVRDSTTPYVARFVEANRSFLSAYRVMYVSSAGLRYLLEMLMILGFALVVAIAALAGSVSSALVAIGLMLAGGLRLVPSLNTVLSSTNALRAYGSAITLLETELSRPPNAARESSPTSLDPTGAFVVRGVTFRYPTRDEPALAGVSLEVAAGEAIGVVGTTGSGKSTLVDLLLGLIEPDEGAIEIDGEPLREHLHAWRRRIGFVPQEIFIADDTVAANIAFGLPAADDADERLARAVRLAHLQDVVALLPDGMETMLGERGVRLSGGQRQRIGLARALYGDPSVLILDEATSALDNETERSIGEALASLHGALTMVVIAHRLSTVRACDRIVFLEGGRIGAIGAFDDLARDHAGFARLVALGSLGDVP